MSVPHAVLRAAEEEVRRNLSVAETIRHPGESGRAREEVIRHFLRSFVPSAYGVDTGFVVDANGQSSKQIDIVIHRTDYHPTFVVGGVKHFMVESVVAVIENKASISSTKRLQQALQNIESVKTLDRSGGGRNYVVMDFHGRGPDVDNRTPQHQVWGAILTQASLAPDTLLAQLEEFCNCRPRHLWPDSYVDVEHFALLYLHSNEAAGLSLTLYPAHADRLVRTDPSNPQCERPLIDFARLLADRLRTGAIIDFDASRYFNASTGHVAGVVFQTSAESMVARSGPSPLQTERRIEADEGPSPPGS